MSSDFDGSEAVGVGAGGVMEISVPLAQFCWEPKLLQESSVLQNMEEI